VANYAEAEVAKLQNPRPEKIAQIVKEFDFAWEVRLDGYWSGEIRDAASSIVANRHLIAHGSRSKVAYLSAE